MVMHAARCINSYTATCVLPWQNHQMKVQHIATLKTINKELIYPQPSPLSRGNFLTAQYPPYHALAPVLTPFTL